MSSYFFTFTLRFSWGRMGRRLPAKSCHLEGLPAWENDRGRIAHNAHGASTRRLPRNRTPQGGHRVSSEALPMASKGKQGAESFAENTYSVWFLWSPLFRYEDSEEKQKEDLRSQMNELQITSRVFFENPRRIRHDKELGLIPLRYVYIFSSCTSGCDS